MASAALLVDAFILRRCRPRFPMTALAPCASCRPWPSRGRPRLWYKEGDLVSIGGVDGIYLRRVDGTRGRAHVLRVADLPKALDFDSYATLLASGLLEPGPLTYGELIRYPRRSVDLVVWGPVELLVSEPDQLKFDF